MKIISHIHKTTVAVLCVLVLSSTLVLAADTTQPSRERGIIKSVDANTQTLVVAKRGNNSEQTFQWNDQTKFWERDKTVTASDLKVSEHVFLRYSPDSDPPILQSLGITHFGSGWHDGNKSCPTNSPGA